MKSERFSFDSDVEPCAAGTAAAGATSAGAAAGVAATAGGGAATLAAGATAGATAAALEATAGAADMAAGATEAAEAGAPLTPLTAGWHPDWRRVTDVRLSLVRFIVVFALATSRLKLPRNRLLASLS